MYVCLLEGFGSICEMHFYAINDDDTAAFEKNFPQFCLFKKKRIFLSSAAKCFNHVIFSYSKYFDGKAWGYMYWKVLQVTTKKTGLAWSESINQL